MNIALLLEISAILIYFFLLFLVAFFSYQKQHTAADFIIGGRGMNFWLTAMAAHASDMSSWLFMGYPAVIYMYGVERTWTGIGLLVFFFLNWQFVAPKVRTATEEYNSLTFSSFFENRLGDTSGTIRVFTALMLFVFYTIYISAALVGMGLVLNTLFGLPYSWGVITGVVIVVPYVFFGGFSTLAWIDFFQGMFLMLVILFVPLYVLPKVGGFSGILQAIGTKQLTTSLIPNFKATTIMEILFLVFGWGMGYFGQPHIVTKFMGIKNVTEIRKSQAVGMSWMTIALAAATLVGLVGIPFFTTHPLRVTEEVFIQMVKQSFPPFLSGFILCAVFAATINAMSSMVLVLSSSLSEDIYKKLVHKKANPVELLWVSRFCVILVSVIAFVIAFGQISTVYGLVFYAWSGLGASFGPLLLMCLYSKKVNKYGAWTGILIGGGLAAIWPLFDKNFPVEIPALLPSFTASFLSIWLVSLLTSRKSSRADILR